MGMDLFALEPTNVAYKDFRVNWTGWGTLSDLLYELQCDLSLMAGSNDGDVVDAETGAAWGNAIMKALEEGRIVVEDIRDKSFYGGWRSELHVVGTPTPATISAHEAARIVVNESLGAVTVEDPEVDLDEVPEVSVLMPGAEMFEWLTEFALFCKESRGFEQW